MIDPITIITIVTAIVSAVFAGSGPILPRLWRGLKRLYGAVCQSTSYLRDLGEQRLRTDIHSMMLQNSALAAQANRYYLQGGMARANAGYAAPVMSSGSGGGSRAFVEFSDFSD